MAKLTVKNVGPIWEAELEVKKHTVFIGPQGSGKSTLAKLIAIGGDYDVLPVRSISNKSQIIQLTITYGLEGYLNKNSQILYNDDLYNVDYKAGFNFDLTPTGLLINQKTLKGHSISGILDFQKYKEWFYKGVSETPPFSTGFGDNGWINSSFYNDFLKGNIISYQSSYIPSERNLTATLSNAIWSLLNSDTTLPKSVTLFGQYFEQARDKQIPLPISFLKIRYSYENGRDRVYYSDKESIDLSQSASGYQSIVPLLMVTENQRRQSHRRFIIEEPELNLYPTVQKDLIYSLMGGLQPDVEYKDAEWVITTHSPYVLSSFNTLMLAYKVAQKSDELRAEVEKIIPSRCWINPDEFAAYYVDKGTVRNIISEKTGLIADNELDDVSEDLAGEQDQLFELSRSVPRD